MMANQGKNSYNLQKTNPLLFTANMSSPFEEVFAPAIAAPTQHVICNSKYFIIMGVRAMGSL